MIRVTLDGAKLKGYVLLVVQLVGAISNRDHAGIVAVAQLISERAKSCKPVNRKHWDYDI